MGIICLYSFIFENNKLKAFLLRLFIDTEALVLSLRCQEGHILGNASVYVSIEELNLNVTIPELELSKVVLCDGSFYWTKDIMIKIKSVKIKVHKVLSYYEHNFSCIETLIYLIVICTAFKWVLTSNVIFTPRQNEGHCYEMFCFKPNNCTLPRGCVVPTTALFFFFV